MVRDPGPHFDQALDEPVYGPLNFFAPDTESRHGCGTHQRLLHPLRSGGRIKFVASISKMSHQFRKMTKISKRSLASLKLEIHPQSFTKRSYIACKPRTKFSGLITPDFSQTYFLDFSKLNFHFIYLTLSNVKNRAAAGQV
jgi:hypothetical protein